MDDEQLKELASQLESCTNLDVAESKLSEGKPCMWLTGNRDALLHIASQLIRAAAEPILDDECRAELVQLLQNQITESATDHVLGMVQRIDTFPENPNVIAQRKRSALRNDRGCLIGCAVVGFIVLSVIGAGILYWWEILTGERP